MAITDTRKDKALRIIEKFYTEGYITSDEEHELISSLHKMICKSELILISTKVENRELLFEYNFNGACINVFSLQDDNVDFIVNYDIENDKWFVNDIPTNYITILQ